MKTSRNIELISSSSRLLLRPPVMDDASVIYDAVKASITELMPWMIWATPDYSIEVTRAWLNSQPSQWEKDENYQFGVFESDHDQFLGMCGINHISRYYLFGNLGYWIRSDRAGEGFATEATKLVARFGLVDLGLRRIEIVTAENNWASRRVAEKSGAKFEGILRERMNLGDRNIDAAMHSITMADLG